jgi:V/A-type H+-transporting ATPase subunit C
MIDWLVGRYDFHNLKALLKAHFLEEDPKEALINIGLVHPKLIEGAVSTGVWEALPEELASAGEKAALEYERTKKPQAIDLIVDAYMYAYLQEKTSFHPWLSSLMRYWCDLVNLKTALRIKLRVETVLNEALVKSGLLSHKKLKELFDAPLENWGEELKGTPYRDLLEDGISFWQEQRSLAHLEKLSDDFIIEQLKSAKFALYGVEPPVAYALAVEYEVKNIRIILVGKINGMSNEVIEERVRVSYV